MLASLPNEILIHITGFLADQKDRVHLVGSCRHFRDVLLPYAFTSIAVNSNCRWTLSCLVHTLLQKPRCGAAVRSLSLINGHCTHSEKLRLNRALLTRALKRIAHTEEELVEWRDNLEGKSTDRWDGHTEDAWRAVLLSLAPNLETLTIEWHTAEKYTGKVLTRASNREKPFDTHPAFARLRSVSIPEWDCDDTPIIADDILHFFRFSSLRQFSAYGVADGADEDEASTMKNLGALSNVTDVSFYGSNSANGFSSSVLACQKLQSFVYENIVWGEWGETWNPPAIFNTLLHHKDTLVKIHVYNADGYEALDPAENVFFGSLANFTALKDLRIRATNLLDWDHEQNVSTNDLFSVLPASLVSLTIENFDQCPNVGDMVEQIEDVMRNRMGIFSFLESLEIGGFFLYPHNDSGEEVMHPAFRSVMRILQLACECSGVEFAMRASDPC